ncbi:2,3-bisphosphoglycerate-independent phosphoglycerate mutase [Patescibacteria group bacterium AH-259-L05]|nr:2,3-bisphosphoglycerate-independent phosphoglycerate mutase [Patescibacteria group bacterium AH-259-L05]
MSDKPNIKTKVLLVILDGWGIALPNKGNAITSAKTPFFDSLVKKYPYTQLCAHGECVGLPKNQVGNSEAGHLNLGAGRVVKDDAVYISDSIKDGTFFKNPIFYEAIRHLDKKNHTYPKVHLIGLVTEENSAHSSPEHWRAMIQFLDQQNIDTVYLHLFTDGRDSSQHGAIKILQRFQDQMGNNQKRLNHHIAVKIASICGRFYAMDRTKTWERIEKTYDLLTLGAGHKAGSVHEAIVMGYNRKETDEFIAPTVVVGKDNKPVATVDNNDVVIFMNLRSDRARELAKAFVQHDFNKKNPYSFKRKKFPQTFFVALTDFGPDLDDVRTAYPSREVKNSLPVVLGGLDQYYITETEKYAHVTFFFNGGYDHPVVGEERIAIRSSRVAHYDYRYEMRSEKICSTLLGKIKKDPPDFACVNFCNADMVAHTGSLEATIKGIEFLDTIVARLIRVAQKKKYVCMITADHGGAEQMINVKTNEIETSHTTNPVPFVFINKHKRLKLRKGRALSDVAPTILDIMGIEKAVEMTGVSLIKKG